jgi:hypothetical protein
LIAFGYWKRDGGQNQGYVRCQTGAEVHATVEWVGGPAFYLLRAITALKNAITFRINVTSLGKNCCPIVNSFEKNYRDKRPDSVSFFHQLFIHTFRIGG